MSRTVQNRRRNAACAVVLLAAFAGWAADPVLPGFQTTPGRLDASLAHETRAALDRGIAWLAHRQQPDGGWAGTNDPALTTLPLLALSVSPDPALLPVRERARAFLGPLAPTSRTEAAGTVLALTQRLDRAAAPSADTVGALLFSRLAAGARPQDPDVQQAYAWIASHPEVFSPPHLSLARHADLLLLTMALAQAGKNRLPMADHSLLTWRPLIARALINRQKVEPENGSLFWIPDDGKRPEDTLAATCYALLTLQVLLAE